MDKRKICLINDSFPPAIDGVANAVVNYGAYIQKNHGEAVVVTPFYPDADDTVFPFEVVRYPSIDITKAVGYRAGLPFDADVMARLEGEQVPQGHASPTPSRASGVGESVPQVTPGGEVNSAGRKCLSPTAQ